MRIPLIASLIASLIARISASTLLVACLLAASSLAQVGCGDSEPGGPADAGLDRPPDRGPDIMGDLRPAAVSCPSSGGPRQLGGCCGTATDCATGTCWNGFCTRACTADGDCGPAVAPSPLGEGAVLKCATNMLGISPSLCLPGSFEACNGTDDSCPAGEGCSLLLDAAARTNGGALAGRCLTRLLVEPRGMTGEACDDSKGAYQCEDLGGFLPDSCVYRRCARACTPNLSGNCPSGMSCEAPVALAAAVSGGNRIVVTGTGLCLGRNCGSVQALPGTVSPAVRIMGADSLCDNGEICVPTITVGAGDTIRLSCIAPVAAPAPFGSPCWTEAGKSNPCRDPSLCAEPSGSGSGFCSTLCRRDDDCPTDTLCLEHPGPTLLNGVKAVLGMCTPRALVTERVCETEADCPAGEGCNRLGDRTFARVCRLRGALDPAGAPCTSDVGCTGGRRCVSDGPGGRCTDVTPWKAVGETCTNSGQCRSGDCRDRDLLLSGGTNRTFCVGPCRVNSDCGPSLRCQRVVFSNNGTPGDPSDDAVLGYCVPLPPPRAADACSGNAFCVTNVPGSDTCDTATGACYKGGVESGDPCTRDSECGLGAHCIGGPRFPGGACVMLGCHPDATTGPDACPGADSTCKQRSQDQPLNGCYEGCTVDADCDRSSVGYICESPNVGQPKSICMLRGGGS